LVLSNIGMYEIKTSALTVDINVDCCHFNSVLGVRLLSVYTNNLHIATMLP